MTDKSKVKKQADSKQLTADSKKETSTVSRKPSTATDKTIAKAGKRSAKAIAETEEKIAKEQRKLADTDKTKSEKPKIIKPPRSKLERRAKKYKEAAKLIDRSKVYSLKDALDLAVKTSITKFDASVELHINLGVDPKLADQNIRGTVILPAGTGKKTRVAVFTDEDLAKLKKVGADIVGNDDFLAQLDREKLDFDILITSPQMMARLAKYARILGPKGLMPNPKSGTVATDLTKAVEQSKTGKIEYRVDSEGIIHLAIGKVSFGTEKLQENASAVLAAIKASKPSTLKGIYMRSLFVSSSMGPSIKTASK